MRTNIPQFRLPPKILDEEIGYIVDMGVDVQMNHPIASMKDLLAEEFDAVFVGTGAPRGKELKLTDVGRRLFEHAVEVLRGEQQTLEDIAQFKQGNTETLNLGLSASINRFYAPALISAYYHENPSTRMKVAELPARSIISAVLSGNVELGLGPFQKDMAVFNTVPLYADSRHLVVSPRHGQFDDMIRGDASALKRTPLIASALDNPDMRPSIQRLRDQFSTVWEVSSLSLRIHMVAEGMGVTFIDRKLLQEHPTCADFRIMDDLSFGRIDSHIEPVAI